MGWSPVSGWLDVGEDTVGFGAPVRLRANAACLRTNRPHRLRSGQPRPGVGRCLRDHGVEADLAHGFGTLTNLFGGAGHVRSPREEVGALLLQSMRIGFPERGPYRVLERRMPARAGETLVTSPRGLEQDACAHIDAEATPRFPCSHLGFEAQRHQQRRQFPRPAPTSSKGNLMR